MNPLARAIIRGAAAPAAFTYDDIPDQLLRINSLEGSLAFSGAVLTGVTDVSGAGETVTVTGSPVYTASNATLNGAPSFGGLSASSLVTAAGVSLSAVRFIAFVGYTAGTASQYMCDGDDAISRLYGIRLASGSFSSPASTVAAETASAGRKRVLWPMDGAAALIWNGVPKSVMGLNTATGAGVTIGCRYNGVEGFASVGFFMACSAVPSAPLLASLEAKLLADFG